MKPKGKGHTRNIRRLRRPLAGDRQGIRDAGGLQLASQGEGGIVPHRPTRQAEDPRADQGRADRQAAGKDRDAPAGERLPPPNTKAGTTSPAIKIPVEERFEIIYRAKERYAGKLRLNVAWMCEELGVSRSGYYAYEAKDYADFLAVKEV